MNKGRNSIAVWKAKSDEYYKSSSKEKLKSDLLKAGFTVKDAKKSPIKGKGTDH
ncbi:hypothetical protein N0M98_03575 [Paenibacillus doosanensis]|uniref:hypothetical protein n=1 Tax=Paenibacillus doosanensis TaxID=1229154 RepID=UPI00217F9CC1|nr:hypothetical protein [Paenibacillus doosanensis]MCS7459213.1 hypothetical protein [Paenibacillus doosanensis]